MSATQLRTLTADQATNLILNALQSRADHYRGRYVAACAGLADGEPDWLDLARTTQAVADAFRTGDLFLDGKVEVTR